MGRGKHRVSFVVYCIMCSSPVFGRIAHTRAGIAATRQGVSVAVVTSELVLAFYKVNQVLTICFDEFPFWECHPANCWICTHDLLKNVSKRPPREQKNATEFRRHDFDSRQKCCRNNELTYFFMCNECENAKVRKYHL